MSLPTSRQPSDTTFADARANPRRDAWPVFRGFYYQIQTTVQRWMHLSPTDVLQCESAEDIEVIRQAVIDGELHSDRVVEQVKVRQKLTLRSEAVVSAIARYFEAMRDGAAPSLFRFITTAETTRERGVVFPRNLPDFPLGT